jgi:integrase
MSGRAALQAAKHVLQEFKGDFRADPNADRFPAHRLDPVLSDEQVTLDDLWDKTTKGYAASTVKRWRPILERLVAFSRRSDIRRIARSDVEKWCEETIASGRASARTFARNDLAAVKTIFGLAVQHDMLSVNPAAGIKVVSARRQKGRDMRGFYDEEAIKILEATLVPPLESLSAHFAAARRWVPWICAYTGARVNEITQIRAKDVIKVDGIWCVRITSEAGTEKTQTARLVPLHDHLIEQGFIEFAQTKTGEQRLFAASEENGKTRAAELTGGDLAGWVRSLGIDDLDVAPNHGWRHRFKTEARGCIPEDFRDAIQGHAPKTQGRKYGTFPPRMLAAEIAKLPRLPVVVPPRSTSP